MRLSTAITFVLTALLTASLLGAVAATPAVSSDRMPEYDTVGDRSSTPQDGVSPPHRATDTRLHSFDPSVSTATTAQSADSLDHPDPKQVIRLTVRENGDVRWTVESRFLLTNESDAELFESYANEVTTGQRNVEYDLETYERFQQSAQQETGREMSIENDRWDDPRIIDSPDDADLGDERTADEDVRIGVLSYSFTWTNFATVDDNRVYFGDAFRTTDGTWMGLSDSQRLVIETPSNFALETPTRLTWNGPYEFSDDELEIVFVRTGNSLLPAWGWLVGGALVIVGLVGGGYLLYRRDDEHDLSIPSDRLPSLEAVGLGGDTANERTTTADDSAAGSRRASSPGSSSDVAAVSAAATDTDDDRNTGTRLEYEEATDEAIDPELLSDEERVLRMLTRNGGRMKQATIVSETGWSNAKVSQLLSKMDDDGEIEKLRIGRENLITLPGVDPTETN